MKKVFTLFFGCISLSAFSLDPNNFTITRVSAPYFIVDGNSPTTLTKAYVGFEVKNNNNSATTYSNLKFTITSIGTSVTGQNYSIVTPASGIVNVGTLAPGESKVCYYYIAYPSNVTPQATFNVQLSDNTASWKTQSFNIHNRSSISANAGGTATQAFTNQDLIGGLVYDDVTYTVGNVQNGDESDFQVAVSSSFDPTKITLLGTQVTASTVPGIPVGTTDSIYFITGNGSNGASITMRWTFRIAATNFTTYLLPCAGSTSGGSNYKYALNTNLGQGTPITVSSAADPLTITKSSNQSVYGVNSPAHFTVTICNPGAYGITIDKITDEIPAGFTYQSLDSNSNLTATNSTTLPTTGATGTIIFEGGVTSGGNTSFYIPSGGCFSLKYKATTASSSASNLVTTARMFVSSTMVDSAQNTVSVSSTLATKLISFSGEWFTGSIRLNWSTANENDGMRTEIERSNDGMVFGKIGEVAGSGLPGQVHTYNYIDYAPLATYNVYRLKIIESNGQFMYSQIVLLNKKQSDLYLQVVYPNPFAEQFTVQLISDKNQMVQMKLIGMDGKTVFTGTEPCSAGINNITLAPSGLQAGNYVLRLESAGGVYHQKLIKNK